MTVQEMMSMIDQRQFDPLEGAWVRALDESHAPAEMAAVLEKLVKADQPDRAETLAWVWIEQRTEELTDKPEALLAQARLALLAAETCEPLRQTVAELTRTVHGNKEHFDAIFKAAGLLTGQSARRALRTLETCLTIQPGDFLANRFDGQVLKLDGFNDAFGEFELTDAAGKQVRMEPKLLADEFDPVEPDDFRVLSTHRRDALGAALQKDPAPVLIGACLARGGELDMNDLKDLLVPDHLPAGDWSKWWSKARTAAKRSEQLAIEGRPAVITYHPGGRSLEEELTPAVASAKMPLEVFALLQQYVREAQARRQEVDPHFAGKMVETLAEMARKFAARRPGDAFAAAVAVKQSRAMNLPAPSGDSPDPATILAGTDNPIQAVLAVHDSTLYEPAVAALASREDAVERLSHLLRRAPAEMLPIVAQALEDAGAAEQIDAAVADAIAEPQKYLEVLLWRFDRDAAPTAAANSRTELLSKILTVLNAFDGDYIGDKEVAKSVRSRIKSTLTARDYAALRSAVAEMHEGVAATIRRMVDRTDGLGQAAKEDVIAIIRETHFRLFMTEKVLPWDDEKAIWTTRAALNKREDELKELVEVTMLENSKAIGAAAELGDLSENSEWQFAIQERDLLKARAAKMQDEINRAKVIDPGEVPTGTVAIGSRVLLEPVAGGETIEATLLGMWDSNVDRRIYSYKTPLAQAMLGKPVGEVVTLKLTGEEADYRIVAAEPWEELR